MTDTTITIIPNEDTPPTPRRTIPVGLIHPDIPPTPAGTTRMHSFLVELVSDGKRLWAVASEEGRRVLEALEALEVGNQSPTAHPPVGNTSPTDG